MSNGPIARERASHLPPLVSTTDAARVCAPSDIAGRGYCGRKSKAPATHPTLVVCNDCKAAQRADAAARKKDR